jgi:hypothetical protein
MAVVSDRYFQSARAVPTYRPHALPAKRLGFTVERCCSGKVCQLQVGRDVFEQISIVIKDGDEDHSETASMVSVA